MRVAVLALCLSLLPFAADAATVCEIVAAPEKFRDMRLEIANARLNPGYHYFLLVGDTCPRVGISIEYSARFEQSREAEEIRDGYGAYLNEQCVDIRARLIGTFHWGKEGPDPTRRASFEIDEAHELTIQRRSIARSLPYFESEPVEPCPNSE